MTQELPPTIEWRGTRWSLGLGNTYYPAKNETHVGLRLRTDCAVWREDDGTWRACLIPSPDCKARSAAAATPGTTAQEALDGEVMCWLATAFKLPGARELLAEMASIGAVLKQLGKVP